MRLDPRDTPKGGHVAWTVTHDDEYVSVARDLIAAGVALNEKVAVFGPTGNRLRAMVQDAAAIVADPLADFLGGGPIDPDKMFAMFRKAMAHARLEGYVGMRVIADMDWMLPASPTAETIMNFEQLLDRVVSELGATVFCVYHERSFPKEAIRATNAVHPLVFGAEHPQFRMTYDGEETWAIRGEVDMAVHDLFESAVRTAAMRPCVIDVSGLEFIDAAGLRTLTTIVANSGEELTLRGGQAAFRRVWEAGNFGALGETA